MSKFLFPTIKPHLNNSNMYVQEAILRNNINLIQRFNRKNVGRVSSNILRNHSKDIQRKQTIALIEVQTRINESVQGAFPFGA